MTSFGQLSEWLRRRDPDLAATRRAARTALVLPSLFALCTEVLHEPVIGTFAAFGTFSMLLLVDLAGPLVQRLRAHAALAMAWLVLVTLGTLAGRATWSAVLSTVVVGFFVLFSGVVSSVLAASTTALLLAFILPVSASAPLSELPDRLYGVLLAAGAAMLAVALLWPRLPVDPLAGPAATSCRAAARQLHADAAHYATTARITTFPQCRLRAQETASTTSALRKAFTAAPYRPTGLSTGSRAVVRLVDELTWLSEILGESGPATPDGLPADAQSAAVRAAAAVVLEIAADLLEHPGGSPERLRNAADELRGALSVMEDGAVGRLPARDGETGGQPDLESFLAGLDVSFRAQEVAFVVLQIAQNVETARAAGQRTWPERLFGREPGTSSGALRSARERATAHLEPHSVWLHNSIRGAVGLGIGITIAETISVQHAFWVMLGTIAVLRSNALNTGQNAFRALFGTIVGSIVGAGVLQLIGHDRVLLWVLLPIAVLGAGIVPAAISFAAGQAAFTLTLVILFNVAQPVGLSIIFFRIEDIAIGCGVSLVVGLFFWPRGASSAVSRALSEAYLDSARYLVGAVDYAVSRCAGTPTREVAQEGRRAAAAARRLDDAFRTYLAERGAKAVPLGEMTTLVTGVVALRLAADAVLELWRRAAEDLPAHDRAAAQQELLIMAERALRWYQGLAEWLDGEGPVPEPLPADREVAGRLVEAVGRDLRDEDGRATGTGVRIIWTGDHLEAVRRLQPSLTRSSSALSTPPRSVPRACDERTAPC